MTREDKNRYIHGYIYDYMADRMSTIIPKYDELGDHKDFYDVMYDEIYEAIADNRFEMRSKIISAVYMVWYNTHINDGWCESNYRSHSDKVCFTLVNPKGSSTRIKKFYTSVADVAYQYAHKTYPKRDKNR